MALSGPARTRTAPHVAWHANPPAPATRGDAPCVPEALRREGTTGMATATLGVAPIPLLGVAESRSRCRRHLSRGDKRPRFGDCGSCDSGRPAPPPAGIGSAQGQELHRVVRAFATCSDHFQDNKEWHRGQE